MKEFNFIHVDLPLSDRESFFGPLEPCEMMHVFDDKTDMADIWVHVGLFPSKGRAKKNNHGGPVPDGWTDVVKKKQGIRVCILNTFEGWQDE